MNLAWKLVVFTFILNISSGIITNIVGLTPESAFEYDSEMTDRLDVYDVQNENSTIFDSSVAYTDFNWAENLLNIMGLGFIVDLMNLLTDYLYGIVPLILAFVPGDSIALQPYLYGLVTLMYTISIFVLFTGKNINSEG